MSEDENTKRVLDQHIVEINAALNSPLVKNHAETYMDKLKYKVEVRLWEEAKRWDEAAQKELPMRWNDYTKEHVLITPDSNEHGILKAEALRQVNEAVKNEAASMQSDEVVTNRSRLFEKLLQKLGLHAEFQEIVNEDRLIQR